MGGHFLHSVISAAQNAASSLTGIKDVKQHHRSVSESAAHDPQTPASNQDYNNPGQEQTNDLELRGSGNFWSENDESSMLNPEDRPTSRAQDVRIMPLRSTVSTLGRGELTLATLGLEDEHNQEGRLNDANYRANERSGSPGTVPAELQHDSSSSSIHPQHQAQNQGDMVSSSSRVHLHSTRGEPAETRNGSGRSRGNSAAGSSMRPSTDDFDTLRQAPNEDTQFRSVSVGTATTGTYKSRKSISSVRESVDESSEGGGGGTSSGRPRKSTSASRDSGRGDGGSSRRKRAVTGFAYASKKRNRDFHRTFRSIEQDDYLLDDFSCALSKEILVHGRMYVSERHVCFNSNILGWVTNLVISFDEIMTLEKKSTAGLFPNGIVIQTLHARHSFASFVSRDTVIDFLTDIWKQTTGHQPASATGKNRQDSESEMSMSESGDDDDDGDSMGSESDTSQSDNEGDDGFDMSVDDDSITSLSDSDAEEEKAKSSKPYKSENGDTKESGESGGGGGGKWPVPLEGPETHEPTSLPELSSNEKVLMEDTVSAPLGVVANMLYGKDTTWIKRFLTDVSKNTDLSEVPSFSDEGGKKTRKFDYIKPLNSSMGPKQTKCNCTETLEEYDVEDHVVGLMIVQTPDVPSGNSFTTRTRTGLCWAEGNKTKIVISYWIEWTGKSWLKSPIEKGAQDGQNQSAKELMGEINRSISRSKSGAGKAGAGAKRKKSRKKISSKKPEARPAETTEKPPEGLLGTINSILSQPLFGAPLYIWLLFGIVLMAVIIWGRRQRTGVATSNETLRLLRLQEEFDMWQWIDSRTPEQRMPDLDRQTRERDILQFPLLTTRGSRNRGVGQHSLQDLREAVRITELRLHSVKEKLGLNA